MTADTEWTLETLRVHLVALLEETNLRNSQRFESQEKATGAAFAAQQAAIQAALLAAEKAVTKAETSTEKRFDASNEFRAQLTDQAATFMPRAEAEQRIGQVTEKLFALEKRFTDSFTVINSRLDLGAGKSTGYTTIWGMLVSAAIVGIALYAALHK